MSPKKPKPKKPQGDLAGPAKPDPKVKPKFSGVKERYDELLDRPRR